MNERLSRRALLKMGVHTAAIAAIPIGGKFPLLIDLGGPRPVPVPPIAGPDVKELAMRAVAAARAAGAKYADVRLTHTCITQLTADALSDERLHVGVRALVNGYWGFAASGIWTRDEMDRLGRAAVRLAKANALGQARPVELAPTPVVADGHWVMPTKFNPFQMDPAEVADVLASMDSYVSRYPWKVRPRWCLTDSGTRFWRQEKALASTEGSYCTQELSRSSGYYSISVGTMPPEKIGGGSLDFLSPAGVGFELYRDRDLQADMWDLLDRINADLLIPYRPLAVGRYDTVLDARAVAGLLAVTLGRATELDRALGYEANAGGTSYLTEPLTMMGSYAAGAEPLTVMADRTAPGGAATVQWDDEGVTPHEYTVVKNGILTDFHTMRESAGWLKPSYTAQSQPVRSHGCAAAPTAREASMVHLPNLALTPGREAQNFDTLVGTIKNGIAFKSWGNDSMIDIDFQCLNGLLLGGRGTFYEVRDGQCVSRITDAGILFRAPELWKSLLTLGDAASVQRYGRSASKGEPEQEMFHSVTAPPALFKQLALIDVKRKS